jgi:hypothetical protein
MAQYSNFTLIEPPGDEKEPYYSSKMLDLKDPSTILASLITQEKYSK